MHRALLSWSSGKDSAWALQALRSDPRVRVVGLLTTINQNANRVAMHAVREELLEAQAVAVGLPLVKVHIPDPCSNAEYDNAMGGAVQDAKRAGITAIAFGDLFLEDVRTYRERKLARTGIEPLFPLWGSNTAVLCRQMIDSGLRAVVTCVDPEQIDGAFAGRTYDASFLDELPDSADPCGERGEFHTFAYAGPMFTHDIAVRRGETEHRGGFVFTDVAL